MADSTFNSPISPTKGPRKDEEFALIEKKIYKIGKIIYSF